jgi:hypothetical protein
MPSHATKSRGIRLIPESGEYWGFGLPATFLA